MEQQYSFTDIEYSKRRKKTHREEFLEEMDRVVPWDEWVKLIVPYYPDGKRGRRPQDIERMLRMTMLQNWFNLSDEGIEDAIYFRTKGKVCPWRDNCHAHLLFASANLYMLAKIT